MSATNSVTRTASLSTHATSSAEAPLAVTDNVGFHQQYDSLAAFRADLDIYCFEKKKNIIEDRKGRGRRSHRYICQNCDNFRLTLTLVTKKSQSLVEVITEEKSDDSEVESNLKEWRIYEKSILVHGKNVVSDDGNVLLEPCLGGSYKASAVSICIHNIYHIKVFKYMMVVYNYIHVIP